MIFIELFCHGTLFEKILHGGSFFGDAWFFRS